MFYNIYCIYVDVKLLDIFCNVMKVMIECLDNVFFISRLVNFIWFYVSIFYV